MSYVTQVTDKSIVFYADDDLSSVLTEVELGEQRLTNAIKHSVPAAKAFRLFERVVKHDNMGRHVNNFSRFKTFRKNDAGQFYLDKTQTLTT